MSKKSEVRTRAFLKIIAKLQAYIRENDYTDGGWLPSGRKMAVMLGCSHLTYCKALKFIEQEAIAIDVGVASNHGGRSGHLEDLTPPLPPPHQQPAHVCLL